MGVTNGIHFGTYSSSSHLKSLRYEEELKDVVINVDVMP